MTERNFKEGLEANRILLETARKTAEEQALIRQEESFNFIVDKVVTMFREFEINLPKKAEEAIELGGDSFTLRKEKAYSEIKFDCNKVLNAALGSSTGTSFQVRCEILNLKPEYELKNTVFIRWAAGDRPGMGSSYGISGYLLRILLRPDNSESPPLRTIDFLLQ